MFKTTLMAACVAAVAAFGMAGTAEAHKIGYKHKHEDRIKNKNFSDPIVTHRKRRSYDEPTWYERGRNWVGKYAYRDHDVRPRHRGRGNGYFGPGWGGLPPYVIRQTLRARGYRRIKFRDRQLPLYVVKACKRGKRFKVGLNRWGKIMWREPRGYCGPRRNYW